MQNESINDNKKNYIESSGSTNSYNYKKFIYIQQKITANLSVIFGLVGFVLMILENEFTINYLYDKVCDKKKYNLISFLGFYFLFFNSKSSSASTIVKSFITGSTGLLLITIVYYYKLKVEVRIKQKDKIN